MMKLCVMVGFLVLLGLVQSKHFVKFSYEETREDEDQVAVPMMELLKPLNVLRFQPAWRLRNSWNNCGKPSKVLSISKLTATPDPVKAGGSAQVSVQGSLQQTLGSPIQANVTIERKAGSSWPHLYSTVIPDICAKMPPGTCPIKQGPFSFTRSVNVPAQVPAGEYRATVNFESKGTWLACVQVIVDIAQ